MEGEGGREKEGGRMREGGGGRERERERVNSLRTYSLFQEKNDFSAPKIKQKSDWY